MLNMLCCRCLHLCYFFFFKQKTAYEMRISDWSSDVCSSDLSGTLMQQLADMRGELRQLADAAATRLSQTRSATGARILAIMGGVQIGRASCRERVCQYV